MAYTLNKTINNIKFDINFESNINVIKGASGTGKTFLFEVLNTQCLLEDKSCTIIDYKVVLNNNQHLIYDMCKNSDIVILDNADLYLDCELFNKLRALQNTIILSIKSTFGLNMKNAVLYTIEYSCNKLYTIRRS